VDHQNAAVEKDTWKIGHGYSLTTWVWVTPTTWFCTDTMMACASVVPISFWITTASPGPGGGGGQTGMVEFEPVVCG
jgi:hypothetical protein